MKKKNIGFIALAAITFFSLVGTAFSTISWFVASVVTPQYKVNGSSAGAYFAYGDGSKDHPYGISIPRHLYNLAWLQYMGQFSDGQYYFEIADSVSEETGLNMNGYYLPPIGTEDNPFVGNFNGNGRFITNLTVTNDEETIFGSTRHPDSTQVDYQAPEIVGLFGVVGNLDGAYTGSYNVDGEGQPSQINTIYDLGISNITVQTTTSKALVGIAAGYVDATISNVAVNESTIDVNTLHTAAVDAENLTDNLSDYGVVGYATDDYKKSIKKIEQELYDIDIGPNAEFNAVDDGDANGWGGSINMTDLYNRLLKFKSGGFGATSGAYAYKRTWTYNPEKTSYNEAVTNNNSSFKYYNTDAKVGVYQIGNRTGTDRFMYLNGGYYVTKEYQEYTEHTGRYITDGTNYLYYNGTTLTNTTSTDTATLWIFSNTSGTARISTVYGDTTYYLYNNNGTLAVSTNNQTTWTLSPSGDDLQIKNNGYQISYYNNQWRLIEDPNVVAYYLEANTGNRWANTANSGSIPGSTTTQNSASLWYVENSTNYVYSMNNGTKMYLSYYYRRNNNQGIRVINATGQNYYYYFTYTNNVLSVVRSGTTYYLRYNNGWTYDTNSGYASTLELKAVDPALAALKLSNTLSSAAISRDGPDTYIDSSQTTGGMVYDPNYTTYFPLNVVEDGSQTDITNYYPKDTNTGYVTVASSYTAEYTWANDDNTYFRKSNMRVSEYPISNIAGSYTPANGFSTIYTLNSSNAVTQITNASAYERYSDSLESLGTILGKNSSNVYGLHFMDAVISKDEIVKAKYAKINGQEYTNYELPVNSIDFNLKEKGFINLFAGMYFSGNNSLFSLHKVIRNSDSTIKEIKEIKEVYTDGVNNHSVIYKFTDNKYSAGYSFNSTTKTPLTPGVNVDAVDLDSIPSGYTLKFLTTQLTNHNHDTHAIINSNFNDTNQGTKIFYFEIPMNDGEYCLGSVQGGTGGYLFYLDIGANAAKTQRTTFYEHYKEIRKVFDYPAGIAIVEVSTVADNIASGTSLDETDTANFLIVAGTNGTIKVTRASNDVEVARTNGLITSATPTLVGDLMWDSTHQQYNIHDPGGDNISDEITSDDTITEVRRLQYYDWNVNLNELIITQITDISLDEGETWERSFYQEYGDGTSTTDFDDMKIYNTATGIKYISISEMASVNTYLGSEANDDLIFKITYQEDDGENVTCNWVFDTSLAQGEGRYYIFQDYVLEATLDNGSVTLNVKTLGEKTIKINNVTITQVGQTVTLTPTNP